MIDILIRFAVLVVGIMLSVIAWGSWTSGEPPPWSLFGSKTEETVLESRVEEGRAGNGTTRFFPVVKVTAPEGAQALEGLVPSFSSFSMDMATTAVSAYPVGGKVPVRWVDGKAMADRIDLFGMAHAVFLSLFAMMILIAGAFWAWAMGVKRKATTRA